MNIKTDKINDLKIKLIEPTVAEAICREITATLPEWFGIPEANERYARGTLERVSLAASSNGEYLGMITLEFPYPNNANIYWMAVRKDYQGKNIGTSLISAAENYCREQGYNSMTVETISQKQADVNYLKTYRFYETHGFRPLFDLNPYGPDNTMVYLLKNIEPPMVIG